MKLLLLFSLCLCSLVAFCQTDLSNQFKVEGIINDSLSQRFQYHFKKQEFTVQLSSHQNKITILPQDKMPCVIPDTSDIAAIPNAWTPVTVPYKPQHQPIPNPAITPRNFQYNLSNQWKSNQSK